MNHDILVEEKDQKAIIYTWNKFRVCSRDYIFNQSKYKKYVQFRSRADIAIIEFILKNEYEKPHIL